MPEEEWGPINHLLLCNALLQCGVIYMNSGKKSLQFSPTNNKSIARVENWCILSLTVLRNGTQRFETVY